MSDDKEKKEEVNHPPHYFNEAFVCSKCGSHIECIDVVEKLNFNLGNAIKYLWRLGSKGGVEGMIRDLQKAAWYCRREATRIAKVLKDNEVKP
jgi:hypothetical protein